MTDDLMIFLVHLYLPIRSLGVGVTKLYCVAAVQKSEGTNQDMISCITSLTKYYRQDYILTMQLAICLELSQNQFQICESWVVFSSKLQTVSTCISMSDIRSCHCSSKSRGVSIFGRNGDSRPSACSKPVWLGSVSKIFVGAGAGNYKRRSQTTLQVLYIWTTVHLSKSSVYRKLSLSIWSSFSKLQTPFLKAKFAFDHLFFPPSKFQLPMYQI